MSNTTQSRKTDYASDQMNDPVSWIEKRGLELRAYSPNVILSDIERGAVQDMLHRMEARIGRIDDDIVRIQNVLDGLLDHRTEISLRAEKLRGRLSLDTKLPPELLAKIFVYCAEGGWVKIPCKGNPSMVVSQVCSYWRSVAFSEPLLWARISVTKSPYKKMSPLVHAILSNCGENGVAELRINTTHSELRNWGGFWDLISTNSCHPRKIQIYQGSLPKLDAIVESYEFMGATHLKVVDLSGSAWPLPDPHIFENCPNIKSIEVIDGDTITSPPLIPLRAQLTRLQLLSTSLPILFSILCQCPHLTMIAVGLKQADEETFSLSTSPLTLERLHLMHIYESRDLGPLLGLLVLPVLKEFFLEGGCNPWPQAEVVTLFEQSACPVEKFSAPPGVVPTGCIIPLLKAMPRVRSLHAQLTDPVPKSTFERIYREGLAPHLQVLKTWPIYSDSLESVIKLLQSRWSTDDSGVYRGIKEAYLPVLRVPGEEDGIALPDLNKNGRRVYFSTAKGRKKGRK